VVRRAVGTRCSRRLLPSLPSIVIMELAFRRRSRIDRPLHVTEHSIPPYLGNPFRRHEGAGLHMCDARFGKAVDELYLSLQRDRLLLILQPISRPNLDDARMVRRAWS
jgi:hypothetical protein